LHRPQTSAPRFPIGSLVRDLNSSESGPGRIIAWNQDGIATVRFEWSGAIHRMRLPECKLTRYRLFGGVPVQIATASDQSKTSSDEHAPARVLSRIEPSSTEHLWDYRVSVGSEEEVLPETALTPLGPLSGDPLGLFEAHGWRGPRPFFNRWALRQVTAQWFEDTEGIPAFVGARIHPLGHQLYAARRVLWDRTPRFILADEVGLGKTIEAGLVIQSLIAENPALKVLVIAPGTMSRQWQSELYLRFGARAYRHIDASMFRENRILAEKVSEEDRLIVSTTALEQHSSLQEALASKLWDLVVVDEAHQFSPDTGLYSFLRKLAENSYGFLALSATPSKREIDSLIGLLSLVAPGAYDPLDRDSLRRKIERQRDIWDRLSTTVKFIAAANREKGGMDREELQYIASEWDAVIRNEPVVAQLIAQLKEGVAEAADELVSYVQEFHRIDHRIIRTRRITVQGQDVISSHRTLEILQYSPSISEIQLGNHLRGLPAEGLDNTQVALRGLYARIACTTPQHALKLFTVRQRILSEALKAKRQTDLLKLLIADPGPAEELYLIEEIVRTTRPLPGESDWLRVAISVTQEWKSEEEEKEDAGCARFRTAASWIRTLLLADPRNKVLVFSQEAHIVAEFADYLHGALGQFEVEQFHHMLEEDQLAAAALKFQHRKTCRVLISDELGGEGRNFQNAAAVLHLDTPWSVSRLEQRIGRLDRVGRGTSRPVASVVLRGLEANESALIDVHRNVFGVYERSLGGIEFVLPELQRRLSQAACHGAESVEAVAEDLRGRITLELQSVDEAFELALDTSKRQLGEATELAKLLNDTNQGVMEQEAFTRWAEVVGIRTREQRNSSWEFEWKADELRRPLPRFAPKRSSRSGDATFFISGTFNRDVALDHESMQFFGPGHQLIEALVEDVEQSMDGRASVFARDLGPQHRGKLFLLVLARCSFNYARLDGYDPSPGLLARLRRFQWPEIGNIVLELSPKEDRFSSVTDAGLARRISHRTLLTSDRNIQPDELARLVDVVVTWPLVRRAVSDAIDQIRRGRSALVEQASRNISSDLRQEVGYLRWLQSTSTGASAENAERELKARLQVIAAIADEKIEIEGLALVVGGR